MATRKQMVEEIKNGISINLEKYKTPDLLESIGNILATLPSAQFRLVLYPLLCMTPLCVFSYFFYYPYHFAIAFWLSCVVLCLDGLFIGICLALLWSIHLFIKDINQIVGISLGTAGELCHDILNTIEEKIEAEIELPSGSLILKTALVGILLPQTELYLKKKFYLFSGFFRWLAERTLVNITNTLAVLIEKKMGTSQGLKKVDQTMEMLQQSLEEKRELVKNKIQQLHSFQESLGAAKEEVDQICKKSKYYVSLPFRFILIFICITGGICLTFLYINMKAN